MDILLSHSSGEPIYLQIVTQIRDAILQGKLAPGTALPSIRQLAKDLQISVITTKRAYNDLEQEGLIDSVVGKGSFVSGGNQEFIREQRLRALESKLREVLEESKSLPMSTDELIEWIKLLDQVGGGAKG
ncbi:HTH-type transcriptional repressor YtrA [compost metagenome]|jgi:GntR family transcriptional regulator|uniref:GntR family transcriptional regulator n=1 Tax=Paenibacillus rhizolycopersici TaxID=2780073 RepID=A0ABS2H8S4_9BACL|nr:MULTISPECIES: GntR family transcriptional regulator [Paenibacillus]MBM6997186.1 GntR family transcriptional regulator [Paenibacillus rhizolycopersici]MUG89200.1 GntR family transcriptional regulator [Paenibacillus timonensis]GIP46547.1 GntR family transcriptional regulator [Paenibacillus sp. J53TS2]